MQFYTAHAIKHCTGLYRHFSCGLAHSTANDTRPTQQAIAQPATRWSAYQRPDALHRYQIPTPRRTLYSSAQPPYYNKVYKGAAVRRCYGSMPDSAANRRPCKPGGLQSDTGSAVRAHRLAPSTRRGSPAAGVRRAARNHWRLSPQIFSGFCPIANRGQQ